jgi:hypothetical protein
MTSMATVRINGTLGNDRMTGTAANEIFYGGAGNDRFDGAGGTDTAFYTGQFADFSISAGDGAVTVRQHGHHGAASEGKDTLTHVDRLEFSDRTVFLAPDKVPVAVGDAVTGKEDAPIVIKAATLLANDSDPDGDGLAITRVGGAAHGTVTLSADGQTITFVPDHDYFGPAQFTYAVQDVVEGAAIGDLRSATGTVQVTIEDVSEAAHAHKTVASSLTGVLTDVSTAVSVAQFTAATGETVQRVDRDGDGTGYLDGTPNIIAEYDPEGAQMVADNFRDSIGYVLTQRNGDTLLTNTLNAREDQGVAEFSLADIPATVTCAKLVFTGGGVDPSRDFSTFEFHVYAGDGAVTIADWNVTEGTAVSGAGIISGPVPTYFTLELDPEIINRLIADGATAVAIHQKALDFMNFTQPQQGTYSDPDGTGELSITTGESNFSQLIGIGPRLELDYLVA